MSQAKTIGDFAIIGNLGEGFSGFVLRGIDQKTNQEVAIKVPSADVLMRSPDVKRLIDNEAKILSTISHPHIIRLLKYDPKGVVREPKSKVKYTAPYIALELCENGDLCELIMEVGRFDEQTARFYFWQLLNAVDFLHKRNIVHRDIKLENLLIDRNLNLKLIDFAFSALVDDLKAPVAGTESYLPPEAFLCKPGEGRKRDLFAVGVILFMMVRGVPPFNNAMDDDPFYRVLRTNPRAFWTYQQKTSAGFSPPPSLMELIEGLLHPNPLLRWDVKRVLSNAWYNEPVDEKRVMASVKGALAKLAQIKGKASTSF